MATNRALFYDLYEPNIRKVIFETYSYLPSEYDKLMNIQAAEFTYIEDYRMGGFGSVAQKPEGTAVLYDDPVPGGRVRYSWTPYGKGFRVTYEAQRDERYGQMKKMGQSLGRAFRNATEIQGVYQLNNGFTAGISGFDGKALFATDHPLLRGGTGRNRPTSMTDLSITSLQDALIDFEKFTDESGVVIMVRPRTLVVGPDLAPMAREILGSQFKPYTADNEINVIQQYGLNLFVSHYLTDADSWFILADKSDHDLQFFWRDKFSVESDTDFDTGDGKMKGYMRNGSGYGDWRGAWGNQGI